MLRVRTGKARNDAAIARVVPQNIVPDSMDDYSSNLDDDNGHRRLVLEMAGGQLLKPSAGGFHLLAARQAAGGNVRFASTVYYFGERGAKNPTAMFMQSRSELEIIPTRYPREHSRYRANEKWQFIVRFKGQPLPGQRVRLETQNGSKLQLLSDALGIVTVQIPDDFDASDASGQRRRGADFVLAAEHIDGSTTYLASFNSNYGPDAFDQRSLIAGIGFTFLGMLSAVPLLRRCKTGEKPAADANANLSAGEV